MVEDPPLPEDPPPPVFVCNCSTSKLIVSLIVPHDPWFIVDTLNENDPAVEIDPEIV